FEKNAAPKFASLRSQVIHNDVNPGNVLVTEDESMSIAGVIDFGDMIRAPLIIDVAIAASYMRSDDEDASALIASLVAGYDDVIRLEDAELELLHDLVRMRLATTIAILHLRLSARAGDDAYTIGSLQGEQSAGRFLARINAMSRSEFADRMQKERGG
ncbi:MAG: phosphotransferase, partial [Gammaproteobacteria bacterium]|nr:phosphotransferase [Gammaproteobacteria bacterium]